MIPLWVGEYVGAEYADRGRGPRFDCWGLVHAVFRDRLGIGIPSYDDAYLDSRHGEFIETLIRRERAVWEGVPVARFADVLVFRVCGREMHVGFALGEGLFLHIIQGSECCIERLANPCWDKRLAGIYRHHRLRTA